MITLLKVNIKKVLLITAALTLALSFKGDVYAGEGLKLTATEDEGKPGEQVVIEINAENAAGTEGGQFLLNFDQDLLDPVAADSGQLVEDAESNLFMVNKEYGEGQLKFMWVTALADTADSGTVCEITFDLLGEGTTALEFTEIVVSPDDFTVAEAVSGKVRIDDAGVDKEENEEPEQPEEDNREEEVAAAEAETNGTALVIGLIVVAALAAVGYVAFRKFKKSAKY